MSSHHITEKDINYKNNFEKIDKYPKYSNKKQIHLKKSESVLLRQRTQSLDHCSSEESDCCSNEENFPKKVTFHGDVDICSQAEAG